MKKNKHIRLGTVADYSITYLILLAVAFIFFFPCLWLILASFSASGSIYSFEGFFPSEYSLDSFKKLFTDIAMYDYPKWFANSLFIHNELHSGYIPDDLDGLLYVPVQVQKPQGADEDHAGAGDVPVLYGYDRRVSADDAV